MLFDNPFDRPNPLPVQCISAGPGYYSEHATMDCYLRHQPITSMSEYGLTSSNIDRKLSLLQLKNPFYSVDVKAKGSRSPVDPKIDFYNDVTRASIHDMSPIQMDRSRKSMFYAKSPSGHIDAKLTPSLLEQQRMRKSKNRCFGNRNKTQIPLGSLSVRQMPQMNKMATELFSLANVDPYGIGAAWFESANRPLDPGLNKMMYGFMENIRPMDPNMVNMSKNLFDRANQLDPNMNEAMKRLFEQGNNQFNQNMNEGMRRLFEAGQVDSNLTQGMMRLFQQGNEQHNQHMGQGMRVMFEAAQVDPQMNQAVRRLFEQGNSQFESNMNNVMRRMYETGQMDANTSQGLKRVFEAAQMDPSINQAMRQMFEGSQLDPNLNQAMLQLFQQGNNQFESNMNQGLRGLFETANNQHEQHMNQAMMRLFEEGNAKFNSQMNQAMARIFQDANIRQQSHMNEAMLKIFRDSDRQMNTNINSNVQKLFEHANHQSDREMNTMVANLFQRASNDAYLNNRVLGFLNQVGQSSDPLANQIARRMFQQANLPIERTVADRMSRFLEQPTSSAAMDPNFGHLIADLYRNSQNSDPRIDNLAAQIFQQIRQPNNINYVDLARAVNEYTAQQRMSESQKKQFFSQAGRMLAANIQRPNPQVIRMPSAPPLISPPFTTKPTYSTLNPVSTTNFGTLRIDDSNLPTTTVNIPNYNGRLLNGPPLMRALSNPLLDLKRQQTQIRQLSSSRAQEGDTINVQGKKYFRIPLKTRT